MAKYHDCWTRYEDVKHDYPDLPEESQIIYAGYTYEDYSGSAIVVFIQEGQLFENHDGHCSCYGLETWKPEKADIRAVLQYKGWPGLQDALFEFIEVKLTPVAQQSGPRAIYLRH